MILVSETMLALRATLSRTADAFIDPTRRRHLVTQVVIVFLPAWAVTRSAWRAAAVVVGYYALYEYVAEPIAKWLVSRGHRSITGPYWERGPQDGETFTRP